MVESERTLINMLLNICSNGLSLGDLARKTEKLLDELSSQGFEREVISSALDWLIELSTPAEMSDMRAGFNKNFFCR